MRRTFVFRGKVQQKTFIFAFLLKNSTKMAKKFNVTGTCFPEMHYMADISQKLASTITLVESGAYFAINRPRQYGKTTTLYGLAAALREQGYITFNMSFEGLGNSFFEDDRQFAQGFMRMLEHFSSVYAPNLEEWLAELAPKVTNLNLLDRAVTKLVNQTPQKIIGLFDRAILNGRLFAHF